MTDTNICPCCRGQKKVMKIGAIMKDCDNCSGVGHVEIQSSMAEVKEEDFPPKKKRGRPARQLQEVSNGSTSI